MEIREWPDFGETVMTCGHEELRHLFKTNEPIEFISPDNDYGKSRWISCCDECFKESSGDGRKIQIKNHKIYTHKEN